MTAEPTLGMPTRRHLLRYAKEMRGVSPNSLDVPRTVFVKFIVVNPSLSYFRPLPRLPIGTTEALRRFAIAHHLPGFRVVNQWPAQLHGHVGQDATGRRNVP